jgi:two-component system, OmpR family, response regulator
MQTLHSTPRVRGSCLMTQVSPPTRVILVEDSQLLAERVRELVEAVPGVELVATAEDEQGALDLIRNQEVDALILDLQLRHGTGFGVLRKMAAMTKRPVVIVFTNYDLPEYRRQAASLGVAHFLDKARDYGRLGEILREIGATPN